MKSIIVVLLAGLVLIGANVFAQDILIDANGNIEVGATNTYGKLKVVGDPGRDAVEGVTSGTGYGIHGVNATAGGFAGYFEGDARVTGDLYIDGSVIGGAAGGGDITGVIAGIGLSDGGLTGDVTLNINFAGTGSSNSSARHDHDHDSAYSSVSHGHSNLLSTAGGLMTGTLTLPSNGLVVGTNQLVTEGGNIRIGESILNGANLTVNGQIESTSVGIKYPDGKTQNEAYFPEFGVAVVAVSGGDYVDPVAAMNAINTWCPVDEEIGRPPCLLKIMPGVYYIGTGSLVMQDYVDIEGSGEGITVITGSANNSGSVPTGGVVQGANNAEIRMLTVENTSTGTQVTGIYNSAVSPTISNVTINVSSGYDSRGIYNFTSSPLIKNVTITTVGTHFGYGIENSSSSPEIINVTIDADGGSLGYGVGSITIDPTTTEIINSRIKGTTDSVNAGTRALTLIANSKLDGGVTSPASTVTCAGVFNASYTFYSGTACPPF